MPISEQDLKLVPFILMYDDETVLDAVAAYRDTERVADWWRLVVDMGGRYAFATFSDIRTRVEKEKKSFLDLTLGSLVGTTLLEIDVLVEQASTDKESALDKARPTKSQMVVVMSNGEPIGLLYGGTQRGGAGLFGSDLVKLAGQYSDLPTTGLVSRRRQEAMAAKKKKSQ